MKLLLDAMYSPAAAARLRARGFDTVSVRERADLATASDAELFAAMGEEGRTIVTNAVVDYVPLYREALAQGTAHATLLLTSDRSMPRSKAGIGRFVSMLEELFEDVQAPPAEAAGS